MSRVTVKELEERIARLEEQQATTGEALHMHQQVLELLDRGFRELPSVKLAAAWTRGIEKGRNLRQRIKNSHWLFA